MCKICLLSHFWLIKSWERFWGLEPFFQLILEIILSAFTNTDFPEQLKNKKREERTPTFPPLPQSRFALRSANSVDWQDNKSALAL